MILSSCNRTHHLCLSPRRRHLSFDASPRSVSVARRRRLTVRSQFDSSIFSDFFMSFASFNFIAPVALGFVSAVGLNRRRKFGFFGSDELADVGEWIWFTSPTPFNRFVLLRCPSVLFGQGEVGEDVNERLVAEERHFVRLNAGRMVVSVDGVERGELKYQRVCVRTEDGGVISLDWPANLNLDEEHGLDTTVLLVPGTVEGSMEEDVTAFVREALRRGLFPIVMNPRGCAASPLTTPKLFTAADSDDISIAIQFINKARPWTTMVGVGWAYGANMLTKYLAEVGEQTPLTAATCIDNPFDLEELTQSIPYHRALDQKLASGLINILRSNKELFQGREKGFRVEQALSAKSLREFEEAISMVSYGFKDIKDFYSEASTRALVGNVKIPLLFVQSNDGAVPVLSVPRGSITENPFTSLLICSCSQSKASVSWYHHLTLEWLAAVELGLLKGRHPLLKDVDATIKPSKGLAYVEEREAYKDGGVKKLLDLSQPRTVNVRHGGVSKKFRDAEDKKVQVVQNGALMQTNLVKPKLITEENESADTERGHVLQTAEVAMNMLDVSMPGTLREDEKKKVLAAVGRGETVMKALQDAVPEDVRGKLTDAVSGIMRAQSVNFKEGIERIPSMGGSKSNILETVEDAHNETGRAEKPDSSNDNQASNCKPAGGAGSEVLPSGNANQLDVAGQSEERTDQQSGVSSSDRKDANDSANDYESDGFMKVNTYSRETGIEPDSTSQAERDGSSDEATNNIEPLLNQDGEMVSEMKEDNTIQKKEKNLESLDQNKMTSENAAEASVPSAASSADIQSLDEEQNDNPKKENKHQHIGSEPNKAPASDSTAPSFNVSEALDALIGMDDSTQVAVNSVFGVIETMITEMEGKDDEGGTRGGDGVKDEIVGPGAGKVHTLKDEEDDATYCTSGETEVDGPDCRLGNKQSSKTGSKNMTSDRQYIHKDDMYEKENGSARLMKLRQTLAATDWNDNDDSGETKVVMENKSVHGQLIGNFSNRLINSISLSVNTNPYADTLPKESSCEKYVHSRQHMEPLDADITTPLLLDYVPEEGQWKLLEQSESNGDFSSDATKSGIDRESEGRSAARINERDAYIEPSYVILDNEIQQESLSEYDSDDDVYEEDENGDDRLEELMKFAKNIILDSLLVEVKRKLSISDLKKIEPELSRDIDKVATAVCLAIGHDRPHTCYEGKDGSVDCSSEKVGTVHGESIIRAISSTIRDTSYLRRVLPVGVIVGSSLAAMRKHFHVSTVIYSRQMEGKASDKAADQNKAADKIKKSRKKKASVAKPGQNSKLNNPTVEEAVEENVTNVDNVTVMVGTVTAALGASAFLAQKEEHLHRKGTSERSEPLQKQGSQHIQDEKLQDEMPEKHESNIVTSLAEKAFSVAAPVVPTKEDGEVDQERLVAMLTGLGQRGGILRLLSKIALLWGGIRGAMSLTDKLITFLRIAEQPLLQRMLGFLGMILVLWSPVVVPLLPAILQGWTVNNPSRISELACIIGFYAAVMLLILLWGKRIRGYENPLEEYGLDLALLVSPIKIQSFNRGLVGGIVLVTMIQFINAILGGACFHWPLYPLTSSADILISLKLHGKLILLVVQAILTATGAVVVEELLFRSWLPQEIAADLGYHQGIILSGLAFSIFQRSLSAIPGMWVMSLALAGLRQRNGGSLAVPIGFRVGIMASSLVLQRGGFLIYQPGTYYRWLTGTHQLQPFSGIVGLAFSIMLAIVLYPKEPLRKIEPLRKKRPKKTNQE